jgi:hypothetical protein
MSRDEIETRKKKAERGWLADPPPQLPRQAIPGEWNKWYPMMGARHLLERKSVAAEKTPVMGVMRGEPIQFRRPMAVVSNLRGVLPCGHAAPP